MRSVAAYPLDAVTGGCFVLSRWEVPEGGQVLDLDIDVENLPNFGRLCLSEDAVRTMVTALGWKLLTPEVEAEMDATQEVLSDALVQLDELVEAMAGMVNLPAVERALDVAARRVSGKDSIQEWVDSLDRPSKAAR